MHSRRSGHRVADILARNTTLPATYAACAPSTIAVSLSTLALSAMPVHLCTAMVTLSSR